MDCDRVERVGPAKESSCPGFQSVIAGQQGLKDASVVKKRQEVRFFFSKFSRFFKIFKELKKLKLDRPNKRERSQG